MGVGCENGPPLYWKKNMSINKKLGALVGGNFVGAAVQVAVPTASKVEIYLRITLLVVQIVIGIGSAIWVYRRLTKNADDE